MQQQQQMVMGDYNPQNYQDPNDFGQGGMRQDFSLDDLNFDPAYMMDNNCTDDLAVSAHDTSWYRVCHGFRLMKQDDYFWVDFDHS